MNRRISVLIALIIGFSILFEDASASEKKALLKIVEKYHEALASGDGDAALSMLSEDAIIQESGHIENYEEYKSHHLRSDMEFSAAVKGERKVLNSGISGDIGWVASSSVAKGVFRERDINSAGAELIVLSKASGEWKITAIHWSSHRLKE